MDFGWTEMLPKNKIFFFVAEELWFKSRSSWPKFYVYVLCHIDLSSKYDYTFMVFCSERAFSLFFFQSMVKQSVS